MAKVITFSTNFPGYHPKKGAPTHFAEQVLNTLQVNYWDVAYLNKLYELNAAKIADPESPLTKEQIHEFWLKGLNPEVKGCKLHTIRAGQRFEASEFFSPRVWSGVPYKDPQIIFWDDTEVKWVKRFEVCAGEYLLLGGKVDMELLTAIATNDGFSNTDDLELWFEAEMKGQIISWSDNVKY